MQDRKPEYLKAYQAWQVQPQALHRVLLEGERLEPPKLKVLPNTRGAGEGALGPRAPRAVGTLGGRVTSRESEPYL